MQSRRIPHRSYTHKRTRGLAHTHTVSRRKKCFTTPNMPAWIMLYPVRMLWPTRTWQETTQELAVAVPSMSTMVFRFNRGLHREMLKRRQFRQTFKRFSLPETLTPYTCTYFANTHGLGCTGVSQLTIQVIPVSQATLSISPCSVPRYWKRAGVRATGWDQTENMIYGRSIM